MDTAEGGGRCRYARRSEGAFWESLSWAVDPAGTSAGPGPEPARGLALQRAGGSRRRYCAVILLHCASAACLSEAIGIFAAAVRQACFALLSAVFTFALLVVI